MNPRRLCAIALAAGMLFGGSAAAARESTAREQNPDLLAMDLEQLMQMTVTSVAKKAQRLDQTAAAVTVLTAEDIRHSGATSLPEALRLVPGVHVAQIDANKWSVSVRGLGGRWAGQLLVLMDGRTLYSPLFGGVYWDVQDTLLEDIERIEVIRGPGGTLWGANAVNGVINIITKKAADTQGGLAYARGGTHDNGIGFRYGAQAAAGAHVRGYLKLSDRKPFDVTDHAPYLNGRPIGTPGSDAYDGWGMRRTGFRLDKALDGRNDLTVQGDIYDGTLKQTATTVSPALAGVSMVRDSVAANGGNLLLRWARQLDDGEMQVQAYSDLAERKTIAWNESIETRDVEFQHRFRFGADQEIVWGGGYRSVSFDLAGTNTVSFSRSRVDTALYNLFLQDEIKLGRAVALTLGSKFEHNEYTGMEPQPSARLLWQVDERQALWGAWSRAVRTPSRADLDIMLKIVNVAPFTPISILGNPDLASERLTAYEAGWRSQLHRDLNVEAAIFQYDYDDMHSAEPIPAFPFSTSSRYRNLMQARSRGFELNGTWQVTPDWRLRPAYSRLLLDAWRKPGGADAVSPGQVIGSGPKHQFQLHSQLRLRHDLDFDATIYHVGQVPEGAVGRYARLDLRLAWKARKDMEISLVGQNLLDDRHFESIGQDSAASDVPRSLYAQVRWIF